MNQEPRRYTRADYRRAVRRRRIKAVSYTHLKSLSLREVKISGMMISKGEIV